MKSRAVLLAVVFATLALSASRPSLDAQEPQSLNRVVPGELLVEPPTPINLGFDWFVSGDHNRNAVVNVAYRRQGDGEWRAGLPLLLPEPGVPTEFSGQARNSLWWRRYMTQPAAQGFEQAGDAAAKLVTRT